MTSISQKAPHLHAGQHTHTYSLFVLWLEYYLSLRFGMGIKGKGLGLQPNP
jgi:hypothetical protein